MTAGSPINMGEDAEDYIINQENDDGDDPDEVR